MDYQYALAYAEASDALCLFTGVGFSKRAGVEGVCNGPECF